MNLKKASFLSESHQNLSLVSQREQQFFPEESCHVACLMMLLKFIHFTPLPSYQTLCHDLTLPFCFEQKYDSSLEEIIKYLVKRDVKFRLIFRLHDWEESLKQAPIMVAMQGGHRFWGEEGHVVVLTKLEEGIFTYLDPWFPSMGNYIKTIDIASFYKHYIGFACQLFP